MSVVIFFLRGELPFTWFLINRLKFLLGEHFLIRAPPENKKISFDFMVVHGNACFGISTIIFQMMFANRTDGS